MLFDERQLEPWPSPNTVCMGAKWHYLLCSVCTYPRPSMLVLTETSSVYNPPSHLSLYMYYVKLHRVGLYTELLYAIIPYLVSVCFVVLISTLLHFYCFSFNLVMYCVHVFLHIQSTKLRTGSSPSLSWAWEWGYSVPFRIPFHIHAKIQKVNLPNQVLLSQHCF